MTFQIVKPELRPNHSIKLNLPPEMWDSIDRLATDAGVDPAEAIQQMLAHVLNTPKRGRKPSRGEN